MTRKTSVLFKASLPLVLTGLTLLLFAPAAADAKGGSREKGYTRTLTFFNERVKHTPKQIREGDEAACLFKTEAPLIGISVQAPSYSNNIGDLTLSVYVSDANGFLPDAFQVFVGDETESGTDLFSGTEMTYVAGNCAEGEYRIYTWVDRKNQIQRRRHCGLRPVDQNGSWESEPKRTVPVGPYCCQR